MSTYSAPTWHTEPGTCSRRSANRRRSLYVVTCPRGRHRRSSHVVLLDNCRSSLVADMLPTLASSVVAGQSQADSQLPSPGRRVVRRLLTFLLSRPRTMVKVLMVKSLDIRSLSLVTVRFSSCSGLSSGQYRSHFFLSPSTRLVSMTIRTAFFSQSIRQKSKMVSGFGPWVAMYASGRS